MTPNASTVWHQKILAFLVAFLGFLLLHQYLDIRVFHYDSKGYWELGDLARLLADKKNIRGYVYPTLLAPIRLVSGWLGENWFYAFRIGSSLVYGFVLTCVAPDIFAKATGGKATITRRLTVPLLMAVLYPGLLVYPLSDLPAFLMVLCGIALATRVAVRGTDLFWAGALISASYNIRTIYLFVFLLVAACIPALRMGPKRDRFLGFGIFLIGAFLVSVPQMVVNKRIHDVPSPMVAATVAGRSLTAAQLQWGITMQRYETSVDPRVSAPTQVYLDRAGEKLFAEENITSPLTVRGYVALALKRPLDFLGIYGRHLVNGIDLRDGKVYITSPTWKKSYFSVISFALAYAGLLLTLHYRHTLQSTVFLVALLLPVVVILPGAIETRFFLPLHFFAWSVIAARFDLGAFRDMRTSAWVGHLAIFVVLLMLFMGISLSTMASLVYAFPSKYV